MSTIVLSLFGFIHLRKYCVGLFKRQIRELSTENNILCLQCLEYNYFVGLQTFE